MTERRARYSIPPLAPVDRHVLATCQCVAAGELSALDGARTISERIARVVDAARWKKEKTKNGPQ